MMGHTKLITRVSVNLNKQLLHLCAIVLKSAVLALLGAVRVAGHLSEGGGPQGVLIILKKISPRPARRAAELMLSLMARRAARDGGAQP